MPFSDKKTTTIAGDLSRRLALLLLVTIGLLTTVAVTVMYVSMEKTLESEATNLAEEFSAVIRAPLHNLDDQTISLAARGFIDKTEISGIRVVTDFGETLFEQWPENENGYLQRTITVLQKGVEVGTVHVLVSDEGVQNEIIRLITYTLAFTGITLVLIIYGTDVLLKSILAKPMDHLARGIKQIASGDLKTRLGSIPQKDLDEIVQNVNRMAAELAEKNEQILHSQKMEAVGTFASGIAHDFNNRLHAIIGYCDLIALRGDLAGPSVDYLDKIFGAAEGASVLVSELLAFGRKGKANPKPLDILEVVENSLSLISHVFPKSVSTKVVADKELWTVSADVSQLEQVVTNLCTNASDAIGESGKIRLELANNVLDDAFCENRVGVSPGRYVQLSIIDDGEGIAPEKMSQIFNPFFTTKPQGKGTGLGLSIVYGIVSAHGGYVECQSEVGRGTAFNIYLPAVAHLSHKVEEAVPSEVVEVSPNAPLDGVSILVVDDEEPVRSIAREYLGRLGCVVRTADSGEEALKLYKQSPSDVVLLDLGMPGMGGAACLKELVKFDENVTVVIASGYGMSESGRDALNDGAVAVLPKPYTLVDLAQKLESALAEG
jgi:signal transduction histidine kinase